MLTQKVCRRATKVTEWYMFNSLGSKKSLVFRSFVVTEVHGPLRVLYSMRDSLCMESSHIIPWACDVKGTIDTYSRTCYRYYNGSYGRSIIVNTETILLQHIDSWVKKTDIPVTLSIMNSNAIDSASRFTTTESVLFSFNIHYAYIALNPVVK